MGTRNKTYGNSCQSARNVARHGEALARVRDALANRPADVVMVEEWFLAALHEMPAQALRDIADAIDPALPAT